MVAKLLSHARHNVVGYLALFVALGGTAMAAKPMLTGADIQDGTINSADLRDRGSASYASPSIQGIDLEANTVTGAEILESTLGQVPSASDADKLGGTNASSSSRAATPPGATWRASTRIQRSHSRSHGTRSAPRLGLPAGAAQRAPIISAPPGSATSVAARTPPPTSKTHSASCTSKGTVKNSAATSEHQLFYLPEGYRPGGDGAVRRGEGE